MPRKHQEYEEIFYEIVKEIPCDLNNLNNIRGQNQKAIAIPAVEFPIQATRFVINCVFIKGFVEHLLSKPL